MILEVAGCRDCPFFEDEHYTCAHSRNARELAQGGRSYIPQECALLSTPTIVVPKPQTRYIPSERSLLQLAAELIRGTLLVRGAAQAIEREYGDGRSSENSDKEILG